jgi:Ni,Fe-hydrogenase III large subunit
MCFININNNQAIACSAIPIIPYEEFLEYNTGLLEHEHNHCVQYFGYRTHNILKLICCMADDAKGNISVSSAEVSPDPSNRIPSFTKQHFSFHFFEREIHENFGLAYTDHPWLTPVRYSADRADQGSDMGNYPFRQIESDELHEIGVGPIHAGIIEPGHFRFICSGEQILHLDIQLGYQHRGIEKLMLQKKKLLERTMVAESIAGDTVIGHTTAFANTWEHLCGYESPEDIQFSRTLALEWERIATHTGDLGAICNDIAYQLGSAVFGRLRTPIINAFQMWCGNRFGKSLIRAGRNPFPFTEETSGIFRKVIKAYEPAFEEMFQRMKTLPSVLARLEKTGIITREQATELGTVGMAARMCNIRRDVRSTHPYDLYTGLNHQIITKHHGDVYSRIQLRHEDVLQSLVYVNHFMNELPPISADNHPLNEPLPDMFSISLVEGWRGEICHCAITDALGELLIYKIKDPSVHNWLALALAVRNNEISDFPVCNKSFNLSYCGHDL